jgi:hypothetical protein
MRAPWTTATLALALASCVVAGAPHVDSPAPASGADGVAGNDLEVSFGWNRWARMKANPRSTASAVRQTRVFPLVLRPRQSFFAPRHANVTYYPGAQRWELRDPDERGSTVIRRVASASNRWLRWTLFKLPRQAFVERAELRLAMERADLEAARHAPPRVALALQQVTPARVKVDWNQVLTPPFEPVHPNFPGMWWDVTRFVRVAHQTGDMHRNLGLVIENAGRMDGRSPELHIWYRIPVAATAE